MLDKARRPRDFPHSSRLIYRQADVRRIGNILHAEKHRDLKIIHLAAETSVRRSVLKPVSTVGANVGVTCATLEFARKADANRFVFASTAAVYGDKKDACHEDDLPNPRSPYAASKLAAEYYCKVYAGLYGIPITILRYFNVYGPGQSPQYAGVITSFLKEVSNRRRPTIFGDGSQTRDFIFVEDVVRATLISLSKTLPAARILNIGTGRATSVSNLAKLVLQLFNKNYLEPIYTPAQEGDVKFSRADISRARREICFRPRYEIDKGLQLTFSSIMKS